MFPEHRPHGICITVHSRRVRGACCLDIGFRHMFSAHDGAAFRWCMCRVAGGVGESTIAHTTRGRPFEASVVFQAKRSPLSYSQQLNNGSFHTEYLHISKAKYPFQIECITVNSFTIQKVTKSFIFLSKRFTTKNRHRCITVPAGWKMYEVCLRN